MLPDGVLLLGIVNPGDLRITQSIVECCLGDNLPPFPVDRISEAWVICLLDAVTFAKDSLAYVIEVLDSSGEPGHGRCSNFGDSIADDPQLTDTLQDVLVFVSALDVYVEVHLPVLVADELRGLGLDTSHVYLVFGQDLQGLVQNTRLLC